MSNIKKLKHPYGYAANTIINDKTLSYNAKGIYLYILSKPDQWDFSQKRIAEDSTTSEHSVRKAVKELENHGLLKRTKLHNGRVVYEVKDPVQESVIQKTNTTSGSKSQKMNTHVANTQVAKTGGISNKDSKVRKSISNKESCEDESSRDIPKVIKLFESVDPKNRRYYSNKTQREACAFLLEEYGLEQVGAALDFYNRVRRIDARYLPTITTPLQLVEKWQQLALYIQRARDKKKEELSNFIA